VTTRTAARILVVDDDVQLRQEISKMIGELGYVTEIAGDGEEAIQRLGMSRFDAIVTDLLMPRMDGFTMLKLLLERGDLTPAVVLTGFGTIREAMMIIHDLKAFWFLEKPVQRAVLGPLLERAVRHNRLILEAEELRAQLSREGVLGDLVGRSAPMQRVFSLIRQVAPTTASVLISGESGTGKELCANAIHRLSQRAPGRFVALNCAAIPADLLESELFGHEKGAFTGALGRQAGCFENADGGTLFLDEISEMAMPMQAKLLRVLEDSRIRRLGSRDEFQVDVRILAATNRSLEEAVEKRLLREDLYFRLNVFNIAMPPLRHRREDIPLIAEALIVLLNQKNELRITDLNAECLALMMNHSWPGNVREMRNVLERAMILAREGTVLARHLPAGLGVPVLAPAVAPPTAPPDVPAGLEVGKSLREIEEAYIRLTLAQTNNNRTRAAQVLGIGIRTLYKRLAEMAKTDPKNDRRASGTGVGG
jgi:DNA-binding NtrC family response regulator